MSSRARVLTAQNGARFDWPRTSTPFDLSQPGAQPSAAETPAAPARPPEAIEREAFAAGYAQGEKTGFEVGAQRADAMLRRLAATIDELTQVRRSIIAQAEGEMVQLALAVARRIVRREVTVNPEIVVTLARVALERLGGATTATIRLNPEDCSIVQADLREHWSGVRVAVLPDDTVPRGGCRVQSDIGLVDASVDAQLDRVSAELLGDRDPQKAGHGDAAEWIS